MFQIIGAILVIIVWIALTLLFLFVTAALSFASVFIGGIGGIVTGFFKGVFNYFAALKNELRFRS
ncbi:MAG: hypothetical protein IJC99_01265 [Clostridia bacterium]|nr:hypothetical protein [Clostridia bacterium]